MSNVQKKCLTPIKEKDELAIRCMILYLKEKPRGKPDECETRWLCPVDDQELEYHIFSIAVHSPAFAKMLNWKCTS